jgi:hypothetical protein
MSCTTIISLIYNNKYMIPQCDLIWENVRFTTPIQ